MLDFETNGLSPYKHHIIEIAAIRSVPGQAVLPYYQRLVRAPRKLPARIVELTGITDDLLNADGTTIEDALGGLLDFIGVDPVVSYNCSFDLGFLNASLDRHSITPEKRAGHSCAFKLAKKAWPWLSSHRLSAVAATFKLDMSGQHRALGDAKRALEVYRLATFARLPTREVTLPRPAPADPVHERLTAMLQGKA